MNRIALVLVPVVGISLWLGAATFTLTRLESMSKSVSQLKTPHAAQTIVASR